MSIFLINKRSSSNKLFLFDKLYVDFMTLNHNASIYKICTLIDNKKVLKY